MFFFNLLKCMISKGYIIHQYRINRALGNSGNNMNIETKKNFWSKVLIRAVTLRFCINIEQ
ncbi:hypothetical protein EJ350_24530 [Vibrio parahaemolyticus]|nr:hypothetical protein [Vibrio parahaemolyticus]